MLFGGIEAGGTKFVCGIGNSKGEVLDHIQISTTFPDETIARVIDYFVDVKRKFDWTRIGLASFGPLDLNPDSRTFGYITSTPKGGWQNVNLRKMISDGLRTEVVIDTDVNAAGFAEYKWGAGAGKNPLVYLTVGTGIGGGVIIDGKPLHGLVHPEMGHILISICNPRDGFEGICPFHKSCLEGLASGPAIAAHWGAAPQDLPRDHPAWELEAEYLAEGLSSIILTLSPERIILGGGVMHNEILFPMIRSKVRQVLNGYVQKEEIIGDNDTYIVPPGLRESSGLLGAVALVCGE